ncbi:MAG: hypothetical protein LBU79_02995 [Planctomycetota bacterium]|jgi:hypothetical protein|nr:hypothetical protein [Planctomycetota bacterium]
MPNSLPPILHLLGSDSTWEETTFVFSLVRRLVALGVSAALAVPVDSPAWLAAEDQPFPRHPLRESSRFNLPGRHRLTRILARAFTTPPILHAHGGQAALTLTQAWLPRNRPRLVSIYRPELSPTLPPDFRRFCAVADSAAGRFLAAASDTEEARQALGRREELREELAQTTSRDREKTLFILATLPLGEGVLAAFAELSRRLPHCHLLLTGRTDLAPSSAILRGLGLEGSVSILPPPTALLPLMASIDLYLAAGNDSGAGIVLRAAAATGRAVLAAPAHPLAPLLASLPGALTREGEAEVVWRDAMESLLDDGAGRERQGHLMAGTRLGMGLATVVDELLEEYRLLAGGEEVKKEG